MNDLDCLITRWSRFIISSVLLGISIFIPVMSGCNQEEVTNEPSIPAHFITYTDESGIFCISYPPDWELALEQMGVAWERTQEFIKKIQEDIELSESTPIFLAGRPTGKPLTGVPGAKQVDPNVNVIIGPNPGYKSLTKLAESEQAAMESFYEEYELFEKVETTIGGVEAIILNQQFVYPGYTELNRSMQLFIIQDKIVWCITCLTGSEVYPSEKLTMDQVIRSFRILN